jgi:hypothetical protein
MHESCSMTWQIMNGVVYNIRMHLRMRSALLAAAACFGVRTTAAISTLSVKCHTAIQLGL